LLFVRDELPQPGQILSGAPFRSETFYPFAQLAENLFTEDRQTYLKYASASQLAALVVAEVGPCYL